MRILVALTAGRAEAVLLATAPAAGCVAPIALTGLAAPQIAGRG